MTDTLEDTAHRIADRGRDALVARLRPAFEQAAATHADLLELDSDQLDRMVQNAADNADGLQWRRALASVATEELGIGLGEALSHPAVERAQSIVGAPSYEASLAEFLPPVAPAAAPATSPPPASAPAAAAPPPPAPASPSPVAEIDATETAAAHAIAAESAGAGATADAAEPSPPAEPEPIAAEPPAAQPPARSEVRMAAVHLGGIANLHSSEPELELRLSADGLDIVRGGGVVFGRLAWQDIRTLDVVEGGGRGWRRRPVAHLVVHSDRGDARFEVPGVTPTELREHLAPVRPQIARSQ